MSSCLCHISKCKKNRRAEIMSCEPQNNKRWALPLAGWAKAFVAQYHPDGVKIYRFLWLVTTTKRSLRRKNPLAPKRNRGGILVWFFSFLQLLWISEMTLASRIQSSGTFLLQVGYGLCLKVGITLNTNGFGCTIEGIMEKVLGV
uniref:(northern house mosquito) hypothetical protein n=1 Tax=Culex pipiens TaxID=7175 RepID=A0A8D8AF34_CULPI